MPTSICIGSQVQLQEEIQTGKSKITINLDKDTGQVSGSAVDMVRNILDRLGQDITIQVVPWARGYMWAQTRPDVMLFSTTRTAEREQMFKWVGPLLSVKWAFYAPKDAKLKIDSLDDAKQVKAIGTYINDVREQFLIKEGFTNLESTIDNRLNIKKLMIGRIDMFAGSNLGVGKFAIDAGYSPGDLKEVFVIKKADRYMAFSKTTDDTVIDKWRKAYDEMRAGGTFAAIYQKWYPGESVP